MGIHTEKERTVPTSSENKSDPPFRKYPSIFNDVIGPVMRGPSSSHCAAAARIGKISRELMGGTLTSVLVQLHPKGSLATTHYSQGSHMGLCGGLLGWDPTEERLPRSAEEIEKAGVTVTVEISDFPARHPNTYKLSLRNRNEQREMTAVSTGGGMIEITEIDGVALSMVADTWETLIFFESDGNAIFEYLQQQTEADEILLHDGQDYRFIEIKAQKILPESLLLKLKANRHVRAVKTLSPALPVLSRKNMEVPFITCREMLRYNRGRDLDLWKLAVRYEGERGNLPDKEVFRKMDDIVRIMERSIREGLQGTDYADRILGRQSHRFRAGMEDERLLDGGMLNQIILYVTAIMETKSAMGVIVAAPTAGSCAGLPGACVGAASAMGMPRADITKAMLAAGMIGVFIAAHSTFAAEVGGCQAECGAGSGMAAAALASLAGGSAQQGVAAASMALQNILGMICDPVANRVEVPCLGKNVMAAANALACANMALSDYDPVIPLDEVISAMDAVGKSLPSELRCTALGGLSVTETSREIAGRLKEKADAPNLP